MTRKGECRFRSFFGVRWNRFLEQQIYKVSHEKIGEMEIFLVPLGPDKTGIKYEVIFT